MLYCPFCDGQGVVHKAKVEKLKRVIYICDECDTVWLDGKKISIEHSTRFDDFMVRNNLKPLWSELNDIVREYGKK